MSSTTCRHVAPEERIKKPKESVSNSTSEPHFQVHQKAFVDILGPEPSIELILEKDYAFAHEAGVYFPDQDAVFITSNILQSEDKTHEIRISKLKRQSDGSWDCQELDTGVTMANGGINYDSKILFCDQGHKGHPGGLVVMDPEPPYETKTIASHYHGRSFNSVNDVVLHTDGTIWFTDPIYGHEQGFRHKPQLPGQVYRLDVKTGDIRVVADDFQRPNGICFSPDEKTLYVTDTDWIHGDGTTDDSRPSTVYAFDVMERNGSHFLGNRRLFAMADSGVPDGIKCDLDGNVYSGCGDGVNVWTAGGALIGKIVVPGGVANFCFAKKGELILMNETRLWLAHISPSVQGALLANMNIAVD